MAAAVRAAVREVASGSPMKSIGTRLLLVLLPALVLTFGLSAAATVWMARRNVERYTYKWAARVSDVVVRSAEHAMLHNDNEVLDNTIRAVGSQPGVERLRVLNSRGVVVHSADPADKGHLLDQGSEGCRGCHRSQATTAAILSGEHFHTYTVNGQRMLAVMSPILNRAECSNAACHAHDAKQQVLGVLDAHFSLAEADANTAQVGGSLMELAAVAAAFLCVLAWLLIWNLVHRPLRMLQNGTRRLSQGQLGLQIPITSKDEVGELARSFNTMSRDLLEARHEVTAWAHTLEGRVQQKTNELKRAHDQMMNVEKMLTIGQMAAVVAHEINNPLAGIVTYAKLVKRWISKGPLNEEQQGKATESLDLIASESLRCGDLVKNLLMFSHRAPIHMQESDLNGIVRQSLRLAQHKTELQGIFVTFAPDSELPLVHCDPSQIEQVIVALIMNAIDAMPRGGNLWIGTRSLPNNEVELVVRDDGMGIPPELEPKIFEPFTTTKEVGKGVGLGCAVSKNIVERHGGRIHFTSQLGVGTTFYVQLPVDARVSEEAQAALASADQEHA